MREARGGVWARGKRAAARRARKYAVHRARVEICGAGWAGNARASGWARDGWARGRGAADGQARRSQADGRAWEDVQARRAAGARRRGVQRISYFLIDFVFI